MKHLMTVSLILTITCLSTGCLQPEDYQPPTKAGSAEVQWELAGSWGGEAEISTLSEDPWLVRFKPGGFKNIAGICATADEVWVCDKDISRLQVFDFEGNFMRSIGEGMPLRGMNPGEVGILLTDIELYEIYKDYDRKAGPSYEDQHIDDWIGQEATRFCATDVAVTAEGYYIADQVRLKVIKRAPRSANVVFIPFDGDIVRAYELNMFWPDYLSVQGTCAVVVEPQNNTLTLLEVGGVKWPKKLLGNANNQYERMVELKVEGRGSPRFQQDMAYLAGAGTDSASFNRPAGAALAFDKLLVCDTGNGRLKVYDARRTNPARWGQLVTIIGNLTNDLVMRFSQPRDIDVDQDGLIYVLDEDQDRLEVVVLDQAFFRLGSFGHGDLLEPKYIDLSDDGRHCFVSDGRGNKVWHYVRTD